MKVLYFVTFFITCVSVFGYPHQDCFETLDEQQFECRRNLNALIPIRSFNVPDLDSSENELPAIAIDDSRLIENVSVTLDKEVVTGTFTFTNGVVEGLSTLFHDFDYDPTDKRIELYTSLKLIRLNGLYEIVDGQSNLTTLGHHTFSGKGSLYASASGAVASLSIILEMDVETDFLSIANLKFDFNFGASNIMAENLVFDGVPVQWETVNQNITPISEKFLEALEPYIQNFFQTTINELIQGCTFEDLIKVVNLRNQENKQNFPQQY